VALLESSGRPQMQIAAELGIQPSMLRSWRAAQAGRLSGAGAGQANATGQAGPSPADLASGNAKLRRELERTRMERDVPKKAIGIFAEVPR
jgi:transposase